MSIMRGLLIVGAVMGAFIYWLCGVFISMAISLWPVPLQGSVVPQDASNVQLVGGLQQAAPSRLQSSVNVMGE